MRKWCGKIAKIEKAETYIINNQSIICVSGSQYCLQLAAYSLYLAYLGFSKPVFCFNH
jgi:hypothetical protein